MLDSRSGRQDKAEVFKTKDGATLVGQVFRPKGTPLAILVLNGATGVPQDYYRNFAAHAAQEHDLAVMTYDYRDMGRSAMGPIRQSRASMSDWGIADQEAARAKAQRLFPGLPVWVLGHSLGGMTLPLQQETHDIRRVILVASGNVMHSDHPWPYRGFALMFWFGAGPLAARMAGYIPGRLLGLGSDLPAPAYWQWRRWCTSRDTFGGEAGHTLPAVSWKNAEADLKFISFRDDQLIPPKCVALHAQNYGRTGEEMQIIEPKAYGLSRIGHIGGFARRSQAIWDELLS